MEKFLMALLVTAVMMTRGAYNEFRGWKLPEDENPDDEGYKVIDPKTGNVSWVPKEKFESTARQINNLTFGLAVEAMKLGKKVAREGWNGKGMFLMAQTPDEHSKMTHPYLFMTIPECEEGTRRLPWQPAQVDLFAEDWYVVE